MGDIGIVRGSDTGPGRAFKCLAGGAIEEGDLVAFGSTDGEVIKVATNGIDAIGVAMEDIADTEYGMIWRVGPNTLVEGATASDSGLLQGDEVGIVVDGGTGAITFDEDASNIAGYVYKVISSTLCQVRLIPTGQKI